MWWILGSIVAAIWLFVSCLGSYRIISEHRRFQISTGELTRALLFMAFWPVVLVGSGVMIGTVIVCFLVVELMRN